MTKTYWLCFTLLSDATFGRGEGLAGLVDQEVSHDEHGLPYLQGRTLKGLLNEECANILYALDRSGAAMEGWHQAAHYLFGGPGSTLNEAGQLYIGPAQLPGDLRLAIQQSLQGPRPALQPADILESLTAIRRQTAIDEVTGVAEAHTLRAMRVILRQTPFEARLTLNGDPPEKALPLLTAAVLALRRAGTGRNRGRGRLKAALHNDQEGQPAYDPLTEEQFQVFTGEIGQ